MATSRSGYKPHNNLRPQKNVICAFWLKGCCTRNPCRFLHPHTPTPPPTHQHFQYRVCDYWLSGSCAYGDKCRSLHTWFHSDEDNQSLSMLARIQAHKKAVVGLGLPSGSNELYSGSKDGTIRVWDCDSGECVKLINCGAQIGCLISNGRWVFIGLPNAVKVWRLDVASGDYDEFVVDGPVGQVQAIAVCNGVLFAGSQDGVIRAWRGSSHINGFQMVASLEAHSGPVLALSVQGESNRLFSSSTDGTIKVWDLDNLECIQTLSTAHNGAVTCLLCSDEYLFSGSLDKTIKAWATNQGGDFELAYTHEEESGVVAVFGMADAEAKPILFSSCEDSTVRLYDLPSFKERGRLFSRKEVEAIQSGPGSLFFLGEATGTISIWNWRAEEENLSE